MDPASIVHMNAVIACGGTGGHLFPGLAVAEVLRERGHEVLLFISEKEIDALALSGRSEFRFRKIADRRAAFAFFARDSRIRCGASTKASSLCRGIYRKFNPHVVLGMGGFTSTAPVLAGRMRGIPTFIHESNAIPGKGQPAHRANGPRRPARLQGMRAVFSESAHGSDRHADSHRAAAPSIEKSRGSGSACARICSRCWSWAEARARAGSIRR